MRSKMTPVCWDALSVLEGYLCCYKNKRTGVECAKPAKFAERNLRRLTTNEFMPKGRTGRAYCKLHWGKRNG